MKSDVRELKVYLVSTLHDFGGSWLRFALDQGVPKKVMARFGWWGISVTQHTYDVHNLLIQKLRKEGVVVERESSNRFSHDTVRNNHACALDLGRQVMGNGKIFYADADRVMADAAGSPSFSNFVDGLRYCLQGEAVGIDLLSVIRDPESEIDSRRFTEIPLNILMSEIAGCTVDPLGSYTVMSRRMVDLAVETSKDEGITFPAGEWLVRAKEAGFKIGGYFPLQEAIGGFESPAVVDWREMERVAKQHLQWERENDPMAKKYWLSRGTPAENLLSRVKEKSIGGRERVGLLWGMYKDEARLRREWEGRLGHGQSILTFIHQESEDGRLVLNPLTKRMLGEVDRYYKRLELLVSVGKTERDRYYISDEVLGELSNKFKSFESSSIVKKWESSFSGFDLPLKAIGDDEIARGVAFIAGKMDGYPIIVEDPSLRDMLDRMKNGETGLSVLIPRRISPSRETE